jgi:predicted DNA-binding protein
MTQTKTKIPYFLRLSPEIIFSLRELSATNSCTVTSIIETAIQKHLDACPDLKQGNQPEGAQPAAWIVDEV